MKMVIRRSESRRARAFTLVEMMLSTAIIALLLLILVAITGHTSTTWRYTTGKIEQFREARAAFDTMTTRLGQATLNTYWDYDNPTLPTKYVRRSELRFIAGQAATLIGNSGGAKRVTHAMFFHAPLGLVDGSTVVDPLNPGYKGLESLLNIWGYYVELNDDRKFRPLFISETIQPYRYRFRLMECMEPSEKLPTYKFTSGYTGAIGSPPKSLTYNKTDWFTSFINTPDAPVRLLGENIVALVIAPRLSKQDEEARKGGAELAPNYDYDSTKSVADKDLNPKNQLPPVVQLTMVAIDEVSASRLNLGASSDDIFALSGKFTATSSYTRDLTLDPARGENDSLENKLVAAKTNYRVFSTNVPIRAAKWSREQSN